MHKRYLEEAYSYITMAIQSCGSSEHLDFVADELLLLLKTKGHREEGIEDLEPIIELLLDEAWRLREEGCLDWYLVEKAADALSYYF